jgi:hypothetical protein
MKYLKDFVTSFVAVVVATEFERDIGLHFG